MKDKRRYRIMICLGVCLMVLLTACGGNKSKVGKADGEEAEKDTVLMAVGEESISVEEAKAYVSFLKHQYEGSIGGVIWDYQLEGQALSDYAKVQIQNLLSQIKILKQVAAAQEITLTEDELEESRTDAIDYLNRLSKEEKKQSGLTEDLLTSIYSENILANKVFEISTNDVDTNISDDEAKQITVQYLMVMTKGTDKNGNTVDMTAEERKQAKAKAKDLLKQAKDATNFLTFAQSNTDAGEAELTFSRADAPSELAGQAFSLHSGQLSPLIEGQSGYYIIYCVNDDDEDATAKHKEELILKRQKESFEKKFTEWSKEYTIVISDSLWQQILF